MLGMYTGVIRCPECKVTINYPYFGKIVCDPTNELMELEMQYSTMTLFGTYDCDLPELDKLQKRYNQRRRELGVKDEPPEFEGDCPNCGNQFSNGGVK